MRLAPVRRLRSSLGGRFSRVRDLARHLDDVAVRVEDAELPVGAVALREDVLDALELAVGAELAGMRLEVPERPPDELSDGHAVPAARGEVHDRRLEAVACTEPLVLGDENAVERGQLRARVETLRVVLHEGLHVGGERNRLLHAGDRIHDAHLDRPEAWMEADVPPDVRVVRDAAGLLELADDFGVVGIVAEARRRPGAREGSEDHLAARRESGRLAAPERRVGGEGKEVREVEEKRARHLDRLFGVVHGYVDVETEDELAARDVLELIDEISIAVPRGDPLTLEEAEWMRAGGADAHAALARDPADEAP